MKRFLLGITSFSGIILVIIFLLNQFQRYFNNEPPHYKLQYQETTNSKSTYNGIIIGNSQATHSIRPSLLDTSNLKFFNLALNGSSPTFYIEWLENLFIDNHPKIHYWIITTDFNFVSDEGWRKFEQDSEYFPLNDFLKILVKSNELNNKLLITNRLPFIKYKSRISESFKTNQGPYEFAINDYDRGYISLTRNDKVNFNNTLDFERKLSAESKVKFLELIDKISDLEGKIVFVIPPEYNLDSIQYVDLKDYLLTVSQERGIPLFDFNETRYKTSLNKDENFVDFIHLNQRGSQLYSAILRKTINHEFEKNSQTP
jgi:hypothetical protein